MYEEVKEAIRLFTDMVNKYPVSSPYTDEMNQEFDDLLEYTMYNLPIPESSRDEDRIAYERGECEDFNIDPEEQKQIFALLEDPDYKEPDLYKLCVSIPPKVLQCVLVVYFMRYLLRDRKLYLNHRKLQHFGEFFQRYSVLVFNVRK